MLFCYLKFKFQSIPIFCGIVMFFFIVQSNYYSNFVLDKVVSTIIQNIMYNFFIF